MPQLCCAPESLTAAHEAGLVHGPTGVQQLVSDWILGLNWVQAVAMIGRRLAEMFVIRPGHAPVFLQVPCREGSQAPDHGSRARPADPEHRPVRMHRRAHGYVYEPGA